MQLSLSPNLPTSVYLLGEEKSPLLVIDNFLQDAELLVEDDPLRQNLHSGSISPGFAPDADPHKWLGTSIRLLYFDNADLPVAYIIGQ